MFILPTDNMKNDLGISKKKIDIITKFEWNGLQIIRINRKKFEGSGFPALMKRVIFGHFSQYRVKGWNSLKPCFLIMSKVLSCNSYQMHKMTFISHSIHLEVFFKKFAHKFDNLQGFRPSFLQRSLYNPIVKRWPLLPQPPRHRKLQQDKSTLETTKNFQK